MRNAFFSAVVLCACANGIGGDALGPPSDYGALRFSERAGDRAAFAALIEDARAMRTEDAGRTGPVSTLPDRCGAETIVREERAPWLALAEAAPSPEAWTEDVSALRARLFRVREVEAAYLSGAEPEPRYAMSGGVARFAEASRAAQDQRVRELFARATRDQVARNVTAGELAEPYLDGLSVRARTLWPRIVTSRLARIDCANTAWLRAEVRERGWFDIMRFGEAADEASWLIAQHADRTPAFQAEMLALLEPLAAHGESNPRNVAYLWDRVAVKEGRPQRYATQMQCIDGEMRPIGGLEDPERVDERRAPLGMPSYAAYRDTMARLSGCG